MENIFERACFGKPYRTRDGRKAIYFYQTERNKWHELIVEGETISLPYQDNGLAVGQHLNNSEWPEDIVSEWQDEISEEEYKNKLDELYESCVYWEAYEDEPELFAESLKELLDFAPKDKKTIDYCAYLIKSRKTILNEIDNIVISFAKDKSKENTINYGNV